MDNFRRRVEGKSKTWNTLTVHWIEEYTMYDCNTFVVYPQYDIPTGTYSTGETEIDLNLRAMPQICDIIPNGDGYDIKNILKQGEYSNIEAKLYIYHNDIGINIKTPDSAIIVYPELNSLNFGTLLPLSLVFGFTSDGYMYFNYLSYSKNGMKIHNSGNPNIFYGGKDSNGIFRYKFTKPGNSVYDTPLTISKEYI